MATAVSVAGIWGGGGGLRLEPAGEKGSVGVSGPCRGKGNSEGMQAESMSGATKMIKSTINWGKKQKKNKKKPVTERINKERRRSRCGGEGEGWSGTTAGRRLLLPWLLSRTGDSEPLITYSQGQVSYSKGNNYVFNEVFPILYCALGLHNPMDIPHSPPTRLGETRFGGSRHRPALGHVPSSAPRAPAAFLPPHHLTHAGVVDNFLKETRFAQNLQILH